MSPRRIIGECALVVGVLGGTIVGFLAGSHFIEPQTQLVFAFIGMALGGAFVDICLRGGQ